MTDEQRSEAASKLVDRFALWSGAAELIPVPLVDVATVGGVQLLMLRRLSAIYGVPFSANLGKSFIAGLAGSMIPATSTIGVISAMKSCPSSEQRSLCSRCRRSAGATYAIGRAFIEHFRSAGRSLISTLPTTRSSSRRKKRSGVVGSTPPHPLRNPPPRREPVRARGRRPRALDRHGLQRDAHPSSGGAAGPGQLLERRYGGMVEAIFYIIFCVLTGLSAPIAEWGFSARF